MNIAQSPDHDIQVEFTGPETLAGRYLREFWHPVYLGDELKPGQAKPLKVLGENFTLYRGEGGQVHLTEFRCPHRLTQLSLGCVEGDAIRCMYHGWKFDESGQCTEQPGGRDGVGFSRKVKLRSYPVCEYLGLIFAYIGDGSQPEFPRYSRFENDGKLLPSKYHRACNFFQNMENSVDEVHIPFVHRVSSFTAVQLNDEVPEVEAKETSYGFVQYGKRSGDRNRQTLFIMPTILLAQTPPELPGETAWRDYISWRVPVDDCSHMSFIVIKLTVQPDKEHEIDSALVEARSRLEKLPSSAQIVQQILQGKISIADIEDRDDLLTIQDEVVQLGQGPIADRRKERLAPTDVGLFLLRKLWRRELSALARGEPRTNWVAGNDEIVATAGV